MSGRSNLPSSMNDWPSVQKWRVITRRDLIEKRLSLSKDERRSVQQSVSDKIRSNFSDLKEACIGLYWPIKGEIDLRPLLQDLFDDGADLALPVIVEKKQPMEFWEWHSQTKMKRGIWKIPIPKVRKPVMPTVLLIPLVGFDESGHRLGYGGGYYDRTLAAYRLKPLTIGIGYSSGRLPTIHPQAHDVPLNAIVTELGCSRYDQDKSTRSKPSSPPCYQSEFDSE